MADKLVKEAEEQEDIKRGPNEQALIDKFNQKYDQRKQELMNVIEFLQKKDLKLTQGVMIQDTVEYFRGIHFHAMVLQNKQEISKMVPSFIEDKLLGEIKTLPDSIMLGQYLIYIG